VKKGRWRNGAIPSNGRGEGREREEMDGDIERKGEEKRRGSGC